MSYRDVVLADRPIGYWRLADTQASGVVARDSSGNGHDGAYPTLSGAGAPGLIVGDPAPSFNFRPGPNSMQVPSNAAFTLTSLAIEAWVYRTDSVPSGSGYILTHQNGSYALRIDTSAVLTFMNVNTANYSTGFTVALNTLYHVVVTVVGTTLTVWINGAVVNTQPISALAANASVLDVSFDHFTGVGTTYWPGKMQELAIYPSLSPARILAHHQAGQGLGLVPADRRRRGR